MATSSRSAVLLLSALPHIPQHGFTLSAVLAGVRAPSSSSHTGQHEVPQRGSASDDRLDYGPNAEQAIAALFPGPPSAQTSVERTLFAAWDRAASARTFNLPSVSNDDGEQRHRGGSSSSTTTEREAVETVTALLEERLALNKPVRDHMLKALALESAYPLPLPSLPAALTTAIPLTRLLPPHPALPDPRPLLVRAGRIADQACRSELTSRSWRESLNGPEWYTVRARMALAYLAGELHMLSPSASVASSQDLLRRWAQGPSLGGSLSKAGEDLRSLLEWGGRSWIGILRSRGL
ncbi:hypothetical protein V8E36_000119 [Tilletia maclaganii]